ncbi:MAG TPA: response regulator [Methylocella sp.]
MGSGGEHNLPLQGRGILLVEDEAMVAMLLEDMLNQLGCHVVEAAARVDTALKAVESRIFDVAILDVNLKGETSYPVADLLCLRNVPFLFATGYGIQAIPEPYRQRIVLQKPFRKHELEEALLSALK